MLKVGSHGQQGRPSRDEHKDRPGSPGNHLEHCRRQQNPATNRSHRQRIFPGPTDIHIQGLGQLVTKTERRASNPNAVTKHTPPQTEGWNAQGRATQIDGTTCHLCHKILTAPRASLPRGHQTGKGSSQRRRERVEVMARQKSKMRREAGLSLFSTQQGRACPYRRSRDHEARIVDQQFHPTR